MQAILTAFGKLSLSLRFLLTGGLVMLVSCYAVGNWTAQRLTAGILQNSGTAAALYIQGLVPREVDTFASEPEELERISKVFGTVLGEGLLSDRVVTFKIWDRNGRVLASSNEAIEGETFDISGQLAMALQGQVATQIVNIEVADEANVPLLALPLLEVYVPVRNTRTGEIDAVVQFYQRAEQIIADIESVEKESWIFIATIFMSSGLLLFGIVHAGSRLIEQQKSDMKQALDRAEDLSSQNIELRNRVLHAAKRSTDQSERLMQRIGQDLHDGAAQHLSVANLRLEGVGLDSNEDATIVRGALDNAMREVRAISRGLALPDLERLGFDRCVERAVDDHRKAFGTDVVLRNKLPSGTKATFALKTCAYRFLQEALANAQRHSGADEISVSAFRRNGSFVLEVKDDGHGFDASTKGEVRDDGGQGLPGLQDRVALIGAELSIQSEKGKGTQLRMLIPEEMVQE